MEIINQPWNGHMVSHLNALLGQSPAFDNVMMAVAFAKRSGVNLIKPAMRAFIADGGAVEVVVGIDHQGTSRQGLEELLNITPQIYVFHDNRRDRTFHPKLYLFERPSQEVVAFVGSSNLTAGGLYSNFEMNVRFNLDLTVVSDLATFQMLEQAYQESRHYAQLLDNALFTDLEQRGWLGDENILFQPSPGVGAGTGATAASPSPFPSMPVPASPLSSRSIPGRGLHTRTGKMPILVSTASTLVAPTPASTLLINLTYRDISRAGGKSPDVQITKEVRDANPAFWQWPARYLPIDECYFPMLINRIGQPPVVANVRVYEWKGSHEFRLNNGLIRAQANIDDLLRIDRVSAGLPYEYEITVIPQSDPDYGQLLNLCTPVKKKNSTKKYAYL